METLCIDGKSKGPLSWIQTMDSLASHEIDLTAG